MARTAAKLDLRKQLKHLYAPSAKQVEVVDVPEFLFTMIDGRIEPGEGPSTSEHFQQAMGAMYTVAYTLKFMSKLRPDNPIDFTVMAIEGLWTTGTAEFDIEAAEPWDYTLMMLQPDHITPAMFTEALAEAERKKPNPVLGDVRLERFREGLSVQVMHIGPYADEPATIERMHRFAADNGYRLRGRHHEIYLGDPRRARPENLKTVLRHPVEPAG